MRRILVSLDGTAPAESALPLARLLARRAGAELVLAHAVEPPAPIASLAGGSAGGVVPILPDARTTHELRRARQDYLDDVLARTREALRTPVSERRASDGPEPARAAEVRGLLVDGDPATALRAAVSRVHADLVVMATHGRRGLARAVLGSVAEDVVRDGDVPVLVVPRGDASPDGADPEQPADAEEAPLPRHLLVALDGSPEAEAVLAPAVALARLLGSAVTLATVRDVGRPDRTTLLPTSILDTTASGGRAGAPVPAEPSTQEPHGDAAMPAPPDEHAYLDDVAKRLDANGCSVSTRVLQGHDVVEALLACTEELGIDWYALTSRGRGFWAQLLEGSVAEALMRSARVPVLLQPR